MSGDNPNNSLSEKFERSALTIPTIYEDDEHGRRMGYDIFSRLMKDGAVILNGPVTGQSAAIIMAQLLYLDRHYVRKDENDMITFFINSPGGSVKDGLAIYDTMMRMKQPVRTVCTGMAASMGSFLLMAGAPDERFALPNSEVMIHEAAAGKQGKVTEMDNMQQVFNNTNNRLIGFYNFHTGMDKEDLKHLMERKDTFMNAEEAKALGLVDHVAYDVFFDDPAPATANDNVQIPQKPVADKGKGADQSDASLSPHQQWLKKFYSWKKAWGAFTQQLNQEEAERRGQPTKPAIDDNVLEIAKKRKPPQFG